MIFLGFLAFFISVLLFAVIGDQTEREHHRNRKRSRDLARSITDKYNRLF
jgi:hypothetical protein